MNPYEIDVMKLTPEDYLKMRDRCRELEDKKKQQADCILKLETELSQFRVAMKESSEKIEVLNDSIDKLNKELDDVAKRTKYWAGESHRAQKRIAEMIYKGESNASEAALKDADAKIQSANDRAANAKKEAKEAKERAESASERVRYLERKLRDVESLNDSLMKELANRQEALRQVIDNDADAYQRSVMRYAPSNIVNGSQRGFVYGAIGLCGEAGEASELVKKFVYHGHALDYKHLAIELGDVLWYIAYTAYGLGYSLSNIMAMNQEKLSKRYPDGKFDEERSRNREEGDI